MTDFGRRASRTAWLTAVMLLLYVVFVLTPIGQAVDELTTGLAGWLPAMAGFSEELRTPLVGLSLVAAAVVTVDALLRRHIAAAVSAAVVIAGTGLLNAGLRDAVLFRPDLGSEAGFGGNSLPSGHVAVSVAAACAVLALWRWSRPWVFVPIVAAVPTLVAIGSVASHAHRGSDVVAGALLGVATSQWILGTRVAPLTAASTTPVVLVSAGSTAFVFGALVVADTPLGDVAAWLMVLGLLGAVTAAITLAVLMAPQPVLPVSASGRYAAACNRKRSA